MAHRYYGDFRSNDISTDPNGQKYRVLIFTNYNNTIPYEYHKLEFLPDEHGMAPTPIIWPKSSTQLTMAPSAFTVKYEGNEDNIYKPYKCSTATVSFMQSNFNLNFVNSNGTSTLVMLLKWKNEVSEVNGHMYNSETGETLYKKRVTDREDPSRPIEPIVFFYDYEPYKYDKFCYTLEWVGFSTPETFSMNYSHMSDVFTLNCQDALSVLKYRKYKWIGEATTAIASFRDIILNALQEIGTYKKIYVTGNTRIPGYYAEALYNIQEQQFNNFDEDENATDTLSVLEQIFQYMNYTAVPYKDSLYIINPNAIVEGWNDYCVWQLPDSGYIMNFGGGTYADTYNENIYFPYTITEDTFLGETIISSNNVYNSATLTNDIYYITDVSPNLNNDENFTNKSYHDKNVNYAGSRYYWRYNTMESAVVAIKTHQYNPDTFTYSCSLIDDMTQTYNVTFNITLSETEVETPNYGQYLDYHPTCVVMDNYGVSTTRETSKSRYIYFHARPWIGNAMPGTTPDGTVMNNTQTSDNFRNKIKEQTKKQPMVEIVTKGFWNNSGLYMCITGNWTFYYNKYNISWPYIFDQSLNATANANNTYFEYAKITYGHYYLANGASPGSYTWSTTEQFVKLYYDIKENQKYFGSTFRFTQTSSAHEGIIVLLPVLNYIGTISVTIYRPTGAYRNTMSAALLNNFDIKILTEREIYDEEYKGNDDNMEYKTEMKPDAVSEYKSLKSLLNTYDKINVNYSQVLKGSQTYLSNMTPIYQLSSGNLMDAEENIVKAVANQYTTPTINLEITTRNHITPLSLVSWRQFNGKQFIVNSLSIDYEREEEKVSLVEVKRTAADSIQTRRNRTRNYRRNEDVIAHNSRNRIVRETLLHTTTYQTSTFWGDDTVVYDTGTARPDPEDVIPNMQFYPRFDNGTFIVSVPKAVEDIISFDVANGELIIDKEDPQE